MSVHPLSLRRQLLYKFQEVQIVRFEFEQFSIFFRALLKDGSSGHLRDELHNYLASHRPMGTHAILAEWKEGPTWPTFFDSLSEEQRALAEACDSTKDSVEAVTIQAFDAIVAAKCETVAAGSIRVTIQTRNDEPTLEQISHYKDFIKACIPAPGVLVEVVVGKVKIEPKSSFSLPMIGNQASREGIVDDAILAKVERDED